jgi:DNA-binding XRE family transcriptional regulator
MVDLSCDNCRAFKHDACQRTVRAFIDPDGPDTYAWIGSHAENMRDMSEKGRARRKLTAEQVANIRRRYAREGVTQADLARAFDVAASTISNVVNGRTYIDVREVEA